MELSSSTVKIAEIAIETIAKKAIPSEEYQTLIAIIRSAERQPATSR